MLYWTWAEMLPDATFNGVCMGLYPNMQQAREAMQPFEKGPHEWSDASATWIVKDGKHYWLSPVYA